MDFRHISAAAHVITIVKLPRTTILGTSLIQETMMLDKFEKIPQHLHLDDNTKILLGTILNISECPKSVQWWIPGMRHIAKSQKKSIFRWISKCGPLKHGIRWKDATLNKPHRGGYKDFVLSGISDFTYKSEIKTVRKNIVLQREPGLGITSSWS